MFEIESKVNCETEILDIRSVALKRIYTKQGRDFELKQFQAKVQAEVSKRVGWFYSCAASHSSRAAVEREVREELREELTRIENKYDVKTQRYSEEVRSVISKMKADSYVETEGLFESMNQGEQLPGDYVVGDVQLKVNRILFRIDNEFDQQVMVCMIRDFEVAGKYAADHIKASVLLDDFYVRDLWTQT